MKNNIFDLFHSESDIKYDIKNNMILHFEVNLKFKWSNKLRVK